MYSEDELLPISALQHLAFCERQAALIHIENLWDENVLTAEGHILHAKTHSEESETVSNTRISRGLRLRSLRLGLVGVADVVEFHRVEVPSKKVDCTRLPNLNGWWKPFIVEYKHGSPKPEMIDDVQLCAQAMCLEEMMNITVTSSSFFYGRPRRRHIVNLSQELRQKTTDLALQLHEMVKKGITPAPDYTQKCRRCSLLDSCLPKTARTKQKVSAYLHNAIYEEIS